MSANLPVQCLQHLIEQQVARTPAAVALVAPNGQLTYRQLDDEANRRAEQLRDLGVGPGRLVGVYVDRSVEMVVGLLAILKAGGAYLPLDPNFPADRLAFMVADAQPVVLLTQKKLAGSLPAHQSQVVVLDEPMPEISARTDRPQPTATDLAYVLYTSGSTGKPKGVQIPHQAVVNFMLSMAREPGMTERDVLVAVTTLSFDIAGLELYLPLTVGGRVVLASRETAADGARLAALLASSGATVMQATPITWRLLFEAGWPGGSQLRVFCGGEAFPRDLATRLLATGAEVWNLYGPTETTIWSTVYRVAPGEGAIPIGWPIDNTQCLIFDDKMQPVTAGEPGELLIGGLGVARGYLNRPELTAEKFVVINGARLYRTGDLARIRPDGLIECLGRIDHQVKIRGFRIELGEIETVLAQHSLVKEAVVVAREDAPGEKRLVAYLATAAPAEIDQDQLRVLLRSQLPEYMVPAAFCTLAQLPRTPNGKIDRKALPAPTVEAPRPLPAGTPLEEAIAGIWREVLGVGVVGLHSNFFDLGGHSLLMGRVHAKLKDFLKRDVSIVELYQHPTISKLAAYLSTDEKPLELPAPLRAHVGEDSIAIIGMAGRFPGANNLDEFWKNLRDGVESISFFADDDLRAAGVPTELIANPAYVRAKAIVEQVDHFDAALFGYSPGEATQLDPQQRIFLEAAWSALEDAGYNPEEAGRAIGVYAGASPNLYMFQVLARQNCAYGFPLTIHQEKDYLATRVSYELNLRGPSVAVQTACSTSLVAVHMACRSLLGGECDIALAGAVSAQMPQTSGYLYQDGGIGSKDGHCRVFDADASGTVFGNGVGIVVLKRLADALRDGDTIRAVIKSTAINNDGAGKVGFTAPSVTGQAEVIATAHRAAKISADQISYLEAHGTGTVVGDPIEIAGLTKAFRATTTQTGFCAIGSVKSNIGHLDAAAGMAGLIKTVLALEHRQIPPTLHYRNPNPNIDFANSPFYVCQELTEWKSDGPRRAGVSSFGVGGTNSHVILEEAPASAAVPAESGPQVFVFSARTPAALNKVVANFREHLRAHPEISLADAAFTLQMGRRHLDTRFAVVDDVLSAPVTASVATVPPKIVFMFTGQGAQYAGMGAELYREEREFARVVDECRESIQLNTGDVNQTANAQPLLFILEYALARLWMSWGVEPHAMIGHSIGEYVAACLAGVMSLPEALRLVALRGRLMQGMPAGAMLAVPAGAAKVEEWLRQTNLSIAAVNAPELTVVSGPTDEIRKFEALLDAQGQASRALHTSHAFHSAMMEPILTEFQAAVASVKLQAPRIPYVSNLTGKWLTDAQAVDPGYYAQHLRQAVRFAEGIQEIKREFDPVFLEVGPGQTLKSLVSRQGCVALHSLPGATDKQSELKVFLNAVGQLWCRGKNIAWKKDRPRRRIPLPTYPFERVRYAVDAAPVAVRQQGKRPVDEWFYAPSWRSAAPLAEVVGGRQTYLVLRCNDPLHQQVTERLRRQGHAVHEVLPGEDFEKLLKDLKPTRVVHLWGWGQTPSTDDLALDRIFFPLVELAQAAGTMELDIKVVVDGSVEVVDEGVPRPENAVATGPVLVIPQEFKNITCSCIDAPPVTRSVEQLAGELSQKSTDALVAYRGKYRWTKTYMPVSLPAATLKPGGVYLVTGGFGGMGSALADFLERTTQGKVIRIGRSAGVDVTNREQMRAVIAKHGRITGVIHAAGVPGGGAVQLKTREAALEVMRAKIHGTRVLAEVLAEQPPDFLVLCSSVNSAIGEFGQVDYCAANAFLDAFAHANTGMRTIAINWDMWSEVGMAVDTKVSASRQEQRTENLKAGILTREGHEVLARVLAGNLTQVLVSTRELAEMRAARQNYEPVANAPAAVAAVHPRPELKTAYVAPQDDVERKMAGIWQQLLGIEKIGVHDNFFELGGDSLLAVQVVARLNQALNVKLPVVTFYADPTIAALKKQLAGNTPTGSEQSLLEDRRQARQGLRQRAQRRIDKGLAEKNEQVGE
ncbi:MAG: D-alanine--poly(phosphoribitol) ligase subunit 1 [Verrucomicrobiae bacterium]|nr:D-alanine--poly(phosphoribitol) ligase subunit 1 [Verrucomicrobiae bacterium]